MTTTLSEISGRVLLFVGLSMMRYKTIKNLPVVKQALTTKAVVFQSRELIEKLLYFLL